MEGVRPFVEILEDSEDAADCESSCKTYKGNTEPKRLVGEIASK